MTRKAYKSDLTNQQWTKLQPELPPVSQRGRPPEHSRREIINAIFYVLRAGCAWHLLPHDFPPHKTVYHYFRKWRKDGLWQRLHDKLHRAVRVQAGRDPEPSAGSIDSQSVKTTAVAGVRGFDGGKKVNGRKRHLLVDTQGWVLAVKVHPADIQDQDGARLLLEPLKGKLPRFKLIWGDSAYGRSGLPAWVESELGWRVEVIRHPPKPRGVWTTKDAEVDWTKVLPKPGFRVLPRRWVVERTFAWLNHNRRLSKDYEVLPETSDIWVYVAMSRLMLRRLAAP